MKNILKNVEIWDIIILKDLRKGMMRMSKLTFQMSCDGETIAVDTKKYDFVGFILHKNELLIKDEKLQPYIGRKIGAIANDKKITVWEIENAPAEFLLLKGKGRGFEIFKRVE